MLVRLAAMSDPLAARGNDPDFNAMELLFKGVGHRSPQQRVPWRTAPRAPVFYLPKSYLTDIVYQSYIQSIGVARAVLKYFFDMPSRHDEVGDKSNDWEFDMPHEFYVPYRTGRRLFRGSAYEFSVPCPRRHIQWLLAPGRTWADYTVWCRLRYYAYSRYPIVSYSHIRWQDDWGIPPDRRETLNQCLLSHKQVRESLDAMRRCSSGPLAVRVKLPPPWVSNEWWRLERS